LTGRPLTAGFMGKYLVFAVLAVNGWTWLALLGAAGSAISFGYYGSVLRWAFFEDLPADEKDPASPQESHAEPHDALTYGTVMLAVLTLVVGIQPLLWSLEYASRLLDLGFGG
jgi:NADH-quinone oxidoreductase subunit N